MAPVDTHAHLVDLAETEAVVEHASSAGLSGIIAVSTSAANFSGTLLLASKHPGFVHAALGVHPTEFFDQDLVYVLDSIRVNSKRLVAVGEIGLDYWHKLVRKDKAIKERQIEFYTSQLRLAVELDLPVSIHSRGAWSDCLLYAEQSGTTRGVFHWYSGPLDVLDQILERGFYVSCTPTLESSPELRAAMSRAPLERILVETDSPVWIRSQARASEPADVLLTVKHLALLKGLPEEDVASATRKNSETLF